jgi:hypothetical protein
MEVAGLPPVQEGILALTQALQRLAQSQGYMAQCQAAALTAMENLANVLSRVTESSVPEERNEHILYVLRLASGMDLFAVITSKIFRPVSLSKGPAPILCVLDQMQVGAWYVTQWT